MARWAGRKTRGYWPRTCSVACVRHARVVGMRFIWFDLVTLPRACSLVRHRGLVAPSWSWERRPSAMLASVHYNTFDETARRSSIGLLGLVHFMSSSMTRRQHAFPGYYDVIIVSVCLSVRSHLPRTKHPNFTKFSVHVACGPASLLL